MNVKWFYGRDNDCLKEEFCKRKRTLIEIAKKHMEMSLNDQISKQNLDK